MAKATRPKPKAKPAAPVKSAVKPAAPKAKPSAPAKTKIPVSAPKAKAIAKPKAAVQAQPATKAKPVAVPAKSAAKSAPAAKAKPVAKSAAPARAPAKAPARAASKAGGRKLPHYPAEIAPPTDGKHPFLSKKDLERFRKALLNLRDHTVDEVTFLSGDNLARNSREASGDLSNYSLHMADQGTDNFDRELALNIVSGEQDKLYEIDEALRRIDNLTYGICELTQQPIELARLEAVPYARYCLAGAKEMEKGKPRYRPFGPTISQL
jgi:RNA polymerase-binding transcription factor DksA